MPCQLQLLNTEIRYGLVAILLHWLVAGGVIALYPLGLYITTLDYYDPLYHTLPEWHKVTGAAVAILLLVRFAWRLLNRPPALLPGSALERKLAQLTHLSLYLLLTLCVISGYLMVTADGSDLVLPGGIVIPAPPLDIEHLEDIAGDAHFYLATTLIGLASLHMLAALKHHFIDHDSTLKRIFGYQ